MRNILLDEVLVKKTEQIKNWPYAELFNLIGQRKCFEEEHQKQKFSVEISARKDGEGVNVVVECSQSKLLFFYSGKQKYFYKDKEGNVKDIRGDGQGL
jgi:hypothetical protein